MEKMGAASGTEEKNNNKKKTLETAEAWLRKPAEKKAGTAAVCGLAMAQESL